MYSGINTWKGADAPKTEQKEHNLEWDGISAWHLMGGVSKNNRFLSGSGKGDAESSMGSITEEGKKTRIEDK